MVLGFPRVSSVPEPKADTHELAGKFCIIKGITGVFYVAGLRDGSEIAHRYQGKDCPRVKCDSGQRSLGPHTGAAQPMRVLPNWLRERVV